MFNPLKSKQKPPATPKQLAKEIEALEKEVVSLTKEVEGLKQEMRQAVSRVGLVRFNPFHEIGGNQSFSLALLNEDTNGVVVTSHYGRESNRVYGKRIVKGKAESSLSEEEEKAIQAAKKR